MEQQRQWRRLDGTRIKYPGLAGAGCFLFMNLAVVLLCSFGCVALFRSR